MASHENRPPDQDETTAADRKAGAAAGAFGCSMYAGVIMVVVVVLALLWLLFFR